MKNNTQKIWGSIAMLALVMMIFLSSCQKETNGADTGNNARRLSLYLTDDPCNFDSLFVDIKFVEVKLDTNRSHMDDDHFGDNDDDGDDDEHHNDNFGRWDTLTINPGVYNILKFRNGIDTLLGTANLPAGKIRKIRITLGTNNRVVVNGISKPLNLLPGINKYVYIKIHKDDEDDDNTTNTFMWLDFDVCGSVKLINGQYYLKPFLKPFSKKNYGEIKGRVMPAAAHAFVTARIGTDSATAIPEADGKYKIRGLKPGMYTVSFRGSAGYRDTTIAAVQVQKHVETELPLITLHL